jgi:hypothetical protein
MDEFEAKIIEKLGQENWTFNKNDEFLTVEKAGGGGAKISFKARSRRVFITGKQHQVRSVLTVIQSFARGVGETARSTTGTLRTHHTRRSGAGYETSSIAPSNVYAPTATGSAAPSHRSATSVGASSVTTVNQYTDRVATQAFQAEEAGELALAIGDKLTITDDPDAVSSNHNTSRWVFGENRTTQTTGWFPFSHTKPEATIDEPEARIDEE